jgi:osmoprotectant transport system permease protein
MINSLTQNGWEIGRLTVEHLWLTLSAMLLAAGIGLPLGILLTRRQKLAGPVAGDPCADRLRAFAHTAKYLCRN